MSDETAPAFIPSPKHFDPSVIVAAKLSRFDGCPVDQLLAYASEKLGQEFTDVAALGNIVFLSELSAASEEDYNALTPEQRGEVAP